jgi:GH15 family glucan-1,4-alpha-glucosidase
MASTERDRYPPIDDYGLVGDLRSAALISRQGSVDWLCLPRFDSPSVFGRILDWEKGGYLEIVPVGDAAVTRRYRPDSNVIETLWAQERSRMRVVDFMPPVLERRRSNPPASLRLVRWIQLITGAMDWVATFQPRFDYGEQVPQVVQVGPGVLRASSGATRVYLEFPLAATVVFRAGTAAITGRALPGHEAGILLHYVEKGRVPRATPAPVIRRWLLETDTYWFNWLRGCTYRGRYEELIHRSALVLKLMQYLPSGAFVAAPTTSLPENPGGSLNWDYRYAWLRDTAVLVNALLELGFEAEATGFLRWMSREHLRHPQRFQIMYRVDGSEQIPEVTLDHLEGYRGSRPVRIGNAAVEQLQLDVFGEVMETAYTAWSARWRMPAPSISTLRSLVDMVLARWQEPDSGLWESRSRQRRYLYSQLMCWLALDRALKMQSWLRLGSEKLAEVRRVREQIKHEVLTRGYDERVGAFTQALDYPDLDATGLTVPLVGMLPASDPRVVSTVDVFKRELMHDGFLYRYKPEDSEFHQPEAIFLTCTFWLVDVLAEMGRQEEAEELFGRVTEAANDLGPVRGRVRPEHAHHAGQFPASPEPPVANRRGAEPGGPPAPARHGVSSTISRGTR